MTYTLQRKTFCVCSHVGVDLAEPFLNLQVLPQRIGCQGMCASAICDPFSCACFGSSIGDRNLVALGSPPGFLGPAHTCMPLCNSPHDAFVTSADCQLIAGISMFKPWVSCSLQHVPCSQLPLAQDFPLSSRWVQDGKQAERSGIHAAGESAEHQESSR